MLNEGVGVDVAGCDFAKKLRQSYSVNHLEGVVNGAIRARVIQTRERQLQRFDGEKIYCNAQMSSRQIRKYCDIAPDSERLLESAMNRLGLSARAHDRILKVARTIADLDAAENVGNAHVSEAIQYRSLDRSYWT